MKMKKKTLAGLGILVLTALPSYTFAQMGGGMMGGGYRGGGQGMMGGGQGYGPEYGYRQGPGQSQPSLNLTPEEQKARAKAFVEEYLQRYLPEYKLEKRDSKDSQ
ncbi:MAG: hypothetical protein WCH75_00215 [Candidatus Binatia bacterium]